MTGHSHVGVNPDAANRILDVIRQRVDADGIWDAISIIGSISDTTKLGKTTVRQYLKALERIGVIAMTKLRSSKEFGGMKADRMKLQKPDYKVVKVGKMLDIVKR